MKALSSKIPAMLFLGDLISFVFSVWVTLYIRYLEIPNRTTFYEHLLPFSMLFIAWLLVFFIAGLYEKRSIVWGKNLSHILIKSQLVNALIAVIFFYFIPFFKITPKTNLLIYLAVSSILILLWRLRGYYIIRPKKREDAFLLGSSDDAQELKKEIDSNTHYSIKLVDNIHDASVIIADFRSPETARMLEKFYEMVFLRTIFVDINKVYEDVFKRVPLSLINEIWFLENISNAPKSVYDALKRLTDIFIALILGVFSILIYPVVATAIKLEDGGDVFITQKRIGLNNKIIKMRKFRSMKTNDGGKWVSTGDNRITRVGKFIRKSRIDELPQLWSVIKGDMSLIGPRPDIYDLGMKLSSEIPYYNIRNIIKPGLSGWAQIQQKNPPQSLEDTRIRLAYDFYYIKNRSFILDMNIVLKTIKTLVSRIGM